MQIDLPSDVGDFLKQLVVSGRFDSEQAAIAEGLRLLRSQEQLRADVAKGFQQLDDGQGIDEDEVFAELHREIDA